MMQSDRLLLVLLVGLGLGVVLIVLGLDLGAETDQERLPRSATGSPTIEGPQRVSPSSPEDESVPGPGTETTAETADLEIRFMSDDPRQIEGIALTLIRVEGEGASSPILRVTTGRDGVALFAGLAPGAYRWTHDGSRPIEPVPPNERPAVTVAGARVVVRSGGVPVSGLLQLAAGDRRRILVPLPVGARVSGRVVDAGGILARDIALKLLTRERFVHPGGTEVERLVARRAQIFPSGEFSFEDVRAGAMELLGYWRDATGLSQLRLAFDVEVGETRDLGMIRARQGRTIAVTMKAIDAEGRELDAPTLFGANDVQRVVELRPREPDPDWPYQKIELPQGRRFELRGLPDEEIVLSIAREDRQVNPGATGWTRVGPAEFVLEPALGAECELVERWARIAPLRIRLLDAADLDLPPEGCRLHLIALDDGVGADQRVRPREGLIELRVPEGRYRVLLSGLATNSFRAALSGEFRLGAEGREVAISSTPAGRVAARAASRGRGAALRIGLPRSRGEIPIADDAEGRHEIDLPPGRYRLYDPDRELVVDVGRRHDLGELDGD